MLKKIFLLLILVLICNEAASQNGNSQFIDMLDGRFDVSDYLSENAYGFLPVPIIITDPAVDGGLGLAGIFFHESEEEKDKRLEAMKSADSEAARHLLPPSVSVAAGALTGNDSWFAGGGHMGFFNQGRIRYQGGGGYGDVNLDYYGSGTISLKQPIELNTKANAIFQSIKFKLAKSPFFLGVTQGYVKAEISPKSFGDFDDILPPDFADELRKLFTLDVTTSFLGAILEFDTRDNMFSPRQGYRYTLEQQWYRDSIGSDIDFEVTAFQGLNYWSITEKWRLGLMLDSKYADSDNILPPFVTPAISLRGIPAMRYQGKLIGAMETELTWQLDTRWSVVGFMGAGRASNNTSEFSSSPARVAQGLGFRYQVARRYGFDGGIDIAWGPEETVFYITAGSAWGR